MPIHINLLAESQATEELRRRDPVKRSIYVAVCLVVMVLVWIASLQVKIMADTNGLTSLKERLNGRTNEYFQVLTNKQRLEDATDRLLALNHLAADRFLLATLLDAPMHATVDGIQLTRLRTEQSFEAGPEVPAVKGVAAKAGAVEKVKLVLDAKDSSANPGNEEITKFKQILAQTPYFQTEKISTNNIMLKNLSSPQLDNDSGKTYVMFTLECLYPDKSH